MASQSRHRVPAPCSAYLQKYREALQALTTNRRVPSFHVWQIWTVTIPRRLMTGRLVWGTVWRRRDSGRWIYKGESVGHLKKRRAVQTLASKKAAAFRRRSKTRIGQCGECYAVAARRLLYLLRANKTRPPIPVAKRGSAAGNGVWLVATLVNTNESSL